MQLNGLIIMLAKKDIRLTVSDEAIAYLANIGFEPQFGARPLKRSIQKNLIDPLSSELLAGNFQPGDTIVADVAGGALRFQRRASSDEAA